MELSDQVCSLDLSNRLKEIGLKQDSLFYWVKTYKFKELNCASYDLLYSEDEDFIYSPSLDKDIMHSAFTVAELGELLPNYVLSQDPEPFNGFRIYIEKFISVENNIQINNWIINYHCDTVEVHGKQDFFVKRLTNNIYDPNLANAMAKMLIYIIENGLIKNDS